MLFSLIMKKFLFISFFLITAAAAFGQEFTFQGLKWGSTKEQVIEKLGVPKIKSDEYFEYDVFIQGIISQLIIGINNNGLEYAQYEIGRSNRIGTRQLMATYLILIAQMLEKFGAYHEIIANSPILNYDEELFYIWHFDNFHIIINTVTVKSLSIGVYYCSTLTWKQFEKNVITAERRARFPNYQL